MIPAESRAAIIGLFTRQARRAARQARRQLRGIHGVREPKSRPADGTSLLPGEIVALQAIGRQIASEILSDRRARAKVTAPKFSGGR